MIKLKDLITESSVTTDLKKIENTLKKKFGKDITFDYSVNKKKRGPRGHPIR